ncbi:MAG TPA: hypothetical protein VK524_11550, partial [Polyangiaceae bacterium]|nr:hypothetical protein [Polyangiaceae bacterium]
NPGTCSLSVSDGYVMMPGVPLNYVADSGIDVTSHYEANWSALLQQGLSVSGLSAMELQRQGVIGTLWVMKAGGAASGVQLPASGSINHTTRYSRADYIALSILAAEHDYLLAELQKSGTLFWSWLLAGQPPL